MNRRRVRLAALTAIVVAIGVGVVALNRGESTEAQAGGEPTGSGGTLAAGDAAPAVALESTSGGVVDLNEFRGKRDVLLYFYEHAG